MACRRRRAPIYHSGLERAFRGPLPLRKSESGRSTALKLRVAGKIPVTHSQLPPVRFVQNEIIWGFATGRHREPSFLPATRNFSAVERLTVGVETFPPGLLDALAHPFDGRLMRCVLHGITALEYWRSSLATPASEGNASAQPAPTGKVYGARAMDSIEGVEEGLAQTDGEPGKLHLLVSSRNDARETEHLACHVWNERGTLPSGSIVEVGDGVDVVSPELCLVQLAPFVTRLQLFRAVTDLCARYCIRYDDRMALVQRDPVTSLEKIASLLEQIPGTIGTKPVRSALNWCLEGSRSPRETTMNLFLHLPSRLGGKQLPRFHPNMRIDLEGGAALLTRRSYLEGDAVWLDDQDRPRCVVEYNSDEWHDTEEAMEFDFEKITALESMGMTVIPISTRQFNSYDALDEAVRTIRAALGMDRPPRRGRGPRSGKIDMRCASTHAELLAEERRQRGLPPLAETARWRFVLSRM